MNLMDKVHAANNARAKALPVFDAGDTVKVHVKVTEGDRTRIQMFEGVCIARHNKGSTSSFTVRKMSFGEGVERVFPLNAPIVDKVEVLRRGDVRRAKLYYLRGLTGKKARISERARAVDLGLTGATEAPASAEASA